MKRHVVAVGLLGLLAGGCQNMVYSERPLFTADPGFAVTFRPGLWAAPDKGCRFDGAKPLETWPQCAHGDRFDVRGPIDDQGREVNTLVAGDPIIVQSEERDEVTTDPPPKDPSPPGPPRHSYGAVRIEARDEAGRATAIAIWLVQCGRPSREHYDRRLKHRTTVTHHPFAGLKVVGDNCWATDPGAVRHAAAASEAFGASRSRWMRDEGPPSSGGAFPLTPPGAMPGE